MKRFIAFMVALSLFVVTIPFINAQDTFYSSEVDVLDPSAVSKVFPSTNERNLEASTITGAAYRYSFIIQSDECEKADVTVTMNITVGSKDYRIVASGAVTGYMLDTQRILWEGPLSGSIKINEVEYIVNVGFAKLNTSSEAQISVVMQPLSTEGSMLAFSFGSKILSHDMIEQITPAANPIMRRSNQTSVVADTGNYMYVGNSIRAFPSTTGISGNGQIARAYFNQNRNTLAVAIQTYEYNVNAYFETFATTCNTYIDKLTYTVTITTNADETNHAYIVGFESLPVMGGDPSTYTTLKPIFQDIMSLLSVPTATISALLDGVSGTIRLTQDLSQQKTVEVEFGLLNTVNLSDTDVGLPVVYQLARNVDHYSGHSQVRFNTGARYRTFVFILDSAHLANYYTEAGTTDKTIYITLG